MSESSEAQWTETDGEKDEVHDSVYDPLHPSAVPPSSTSAVQQSSSSSALFPTHLLPPAAIMQTSNSSSSSSQRHSPPNMHSLGVDPTMPPTLLPPSRLVLITGGSGFLGRHLIQTLLGLGHEIRCFDLVQSFNDPRVTFYVGDLTTDHELLFEACTDVDTVFHTASLTDPMATQEAIRRVNVTGTKNVIAACVECGVRNLIYTSTTSVIFNGRDIEGATEAQCPYPSRYLDFYSQSKAEAEKLVVAANGTKSPLTNQTLCTVSLRPHAIFGPRDTHFISKLIARARTGDITHMIGNGNNKVDFTYIGNVIHAMIITMHQLSDPMSSADEDPVDEYAAARARIGGQCYFITNGEPRLFWEMINTILNETGCIGPTKKISFSIAYFIAFCMEWFQWMLSFVPRGYFRFLDHMEPTITRHMVCTMSCNQWYSIEKAQKDLGYAPIVTLDQGLETTINYFFRRKNVKLWQQNSAAHHAPNTSPHSHSLHQYSSQPTGSQSANSHQLTVPQAAKFNRIQSFPAVIGDHHHNVRVPSRPPSGASSPHTMGLTAGHSRLLAAAGASGAANGVQHHAWTSTPPSHGYTNPPQHPAFLAQFPQHYMQHAFPANLQAAAAGGPSGAPSTIQQTNHEHQQHALMQQHLHQPHPHHHQPQHFLYLPTTSNGVVSVSNSATPTPLMSPNSAYSENPTPQPGMGHHGPTSGTAGLKSIPSSVFLNAYQPVLTTPAGSRLMHLHTNSPPMSQSPNRSANNISGMHSNGNSEALTK